MRWRIRWIVNGCAAQQVAVRQYVIALEFINCGLVVRAISRRIPRGRVLNGGMIAPWIHAAFPRASPVDDRDLRPAGGSGPAHALPAGAVPDNLSSFKTG